MTVSSCAGGVAAVSVIDDAVAAAAVCPSFLKFLNVLAGFSG